MMKGQEWKKQRVRPANTYPPDCSRCGSIVWECPSFFSLLSNRKDVLQRVVWSAALLEPCVKVKCAVPLSTTWWTYTWAAVELMMGEVWFVYGCSTCGCYHFSLILGHRQSVSKLCKGSRVPTQLGFTADDLSTSNLLWALAKVWFGKSSLVGGSVKVRTLTWRPGMVTQGKDGSLFK